ncbi:Undecaprenyl-phosphate mannosyltransferase [Posidoniimonas polymericola]|uniref:Undecaprenyl-phosphate mannosyltransferase n=1 Tax=Posidoniimonas polymericola TaxID=2528002 RepID=A0A5C5XY50_9BACT|nr:glycosyltransferase family 2 protein [Posidoniimonas polymericola]TWT67618.1 Undecaprenyl-phosphate mannosyltransferase [Posidoniimonas polymericola]
MLTPQDEINCTEDTVATLDAAPASAGSRDRQVRPARVLVVLPAYNEGEALPPLLESIAKTLEGRVADYEIIVVDDGSADNTALVVSRASFEYPVRLVRHERNSGLAAALRTGLETAVGIAHPDDIIITMDADNTQPPGLMPRMLAMIGEGHDVVIASRFQPGAQVVGVPLYRNLLSQASLVLFKVALPIRGVRDYTCGYRAYRVEPLRDAMLDYGDRFVSERGFSCMVDVLLKLRGRGLVMGEAPMILRYDQKPGASKMRVLRTVGQTLSLIIRRRLGR